MNIKNEILNPTTNYTANIRKAERWQLVNEICGLSALAMGFFALLLQYKGVI